DAEEIPRDIPIPIQTDLQCFENLVVRAVRTPGVEVLVHRLPGAVSFWKVSPRSPRPQDPQNRIEHLPGIPRRTSGTRSFPGDERRYKCPLLVGNFVSMCHWPNPLSLRGISAKWRVFRQSLVTEG